MVTDLCEQEPAAVEHEVRLELSSPVLSLISNAHYTLCVIGVVSEVHLKTPGTMPDCMV